MIANGENPYKWNKKYGSTCFIGIEDSINIYEGEDCIVFTEGGHMKELEHFSRNIPITVKYGFQNRTIMPRYVVYCTNKSMNKFVTEVSGVILDPDFIEEEDLVFSEPE